MRVSWGLDRENGENGEGGGGGARFASEKQGALIHCWFNVILKKNQYSDVFFIFISTARPCFEWKIEFW